MKVANHNKFRRAALTLVELLVTACVIVLLAALLLPVNPHQGRGSKKLKARIEMGDLVNAIESYNTDYGHLPLADPETNLDVSCGISPAEIQDFKPAGTKFNPLNSDLVIVLTDLDLGVNTGHKLNSHKVKYLNARFTGGTNSSGVGIDYQYRDPWGNPYIISLDANQDGFVRDGFYSQPDLFANHLPTNLTNTNDFYQWHGKVMIWSRGPDGKASMTVPANSGANKDNVVSWE